MQIITLQKISALIFVVLIASFGLFFYIFAWTEPGSIPPGGNTFAPINISGTAQTKTGNLTVANLYLNPPPATEGDIFNVDDVIGANDLFLLGNAAETAPIYMAGSTVNIYNRSDAALILQDQRAGTNWNYIQWQNSLGVRDWILGRITGTGDFVLWNNGAGVVMNVQK